MNQRDFRALHGMTLAEFGRRIGAHEQTVWRYESAGRVPNPMMMRRIIDAFGHAIDVNTYYDQVDKSSFEKKARQAIQTISVAIIIIFSAFPAYGASYEELIFCSRWYAGIYAAFQASGEGDSTAAKTAQIESRIFGYRAIAVTPDGEFSNATKIIIASNEVVNRILSDGTESDWQRVNQVCGNLK